MTDQAIDLRSDTFTLPTDAMYDALRDAPLGDDVEQEDPTVIQLQELAAEITGKEATLLVSSGTQANITALMSVCSPGDEVIIGATTDFYNQETSSLSALGGLHPRPLADFDGYPEIEDVRGAIRAPDIHAGVTRAICVENTHNMAGGSPIPPERLKEIAELAHERGIHLHMDGARLFNAVTALGIPAHEVVRDVDTVSFCLSKGLSCPIGSILCGSAEVVDRARRVRKLLGGGMRQVGWIAAPGLVGLTDGVARLGEDHRRAALLADGLSGIEQIELKPTRQRTNMVYFRVPGGDDGDFAARLAAAGVKAFPMGRGEIRYVCNRMLNDEDVERAIAITAAVAAGKTNGREAAAVSSGYAN